MKYIESLRKYFSFASDKRSKCELVVGTSAKVAKFSQFWDSNSDEMLILAASELHNYITDKHPDSKELIAFKLGQASVGGFFPQCWAEVQAKKDST